jgi:hypothetical protein
MVVAHFEQWKGANLPVCLRWVPKGAGFSSVV